MSCRGLFITGTDTGVGKTAVAAGIVRLLRTDSACVGAYKPVASGSVTGPNGLCWGDVEELHSALGGEYSREVICPQRFHAAVAPPIAARMEETVVNPDQLRAGALWWRDRVEVLVVEGAGGLLSPITETESNADLAIDLGFPLLVVSRLSLGTINHTLLTLEAARARGLPVAGILLNQAIPPDPADQSSETNPAELAMRTTVPLLGVIPFQVGSDLLQVLASLRIDFVGLAACR